MAEERDVFIEMRGVHQRFGRNHVLRGVDLDVYRGETMALLGGSGGGKSVLIKHMVGLLRPIKGTVKVDGEDITNLPERKLGPVRKKISMMFQGGALFDSLNVAQNVAFPLREAGVKDEKEIIRRVEEALEIVRLPGQLAKMPADLSGGMRKRVALARAVVEKPCCVLYDEPHAGLDPVTGDTIDHLIKDLQVEHDITNIVITHELRSVFRIADRVVFMKEGRIYWDGSPEAFRTSEDPEIRNFVEGSSGTRWEDR
ncbi:MAG: ATP-binding cassette domain-containing protein [Akkermansiaceae bacterium]|nr:ATP-binding cassette domain-containing protein [Akkermansiaceae bacterium]NNM30075.1 ATP-binding cassette domain-containing protein [Akkermansiaceae bacterium]